MLFWWLKLLCYESYRGRRLAVPHVGTYQRIFTAYKWIENDHTANDCGSCVFFLILVVGSTYQNRWKIIGFHRFDFKSMKMENHLLFSFTLLPAIRRQMDAYDLIGKHEQLDRSTLYLYISNAIFHLAFLSHRIWLNEMRQRNRFRLWVLGRRYVYLDSLGLCVCVPWARADL